MFLLPTSSYPSSHGPNPSQSHARIHRSRRPMDIHCARCGTTALPAGHEDARAFYQCEKCNRVWMVHLTAPIADRTDTPSARADRRRRGCARLADRDVARRRRLCRRDGDVGSSGPGVHRRQRSRHRPARSDHSAARRFHAVQCAAGATEPAASDRDDWADRSREAARSGRSTASSRSFTSRCSQEAVLDAVSRARRRRWAARDTRPPR